MITVNLHGPHPVIECDKIELIEPEDHSEGLIAFMYLDGRIVDSCGFSEINSISQGSTKHWIE